MMLPKEWLGRVSPHWATMFLSQSKGSLRLTRPKRLPKSGSCSDGIIPAGEMESILGQELIVARSPPVVPTGYPSDSGGVSESQPWETMRFLARLGVVRSLEIFWRGGDVQAQQGRRTLLAICC